MQRCIRLAENGLGTVAPNPMAGCVIVHEAKVVGEGFHQRFGQAHAEVNAINNVIAAYGEEVLAQSTLYVNLEPCVHQGKTPPCTDLIIGKKIPKVVIGNIDPFEKVNGHGIRILRQHGVDVQTGILEQECNYLNRRFFTFHEKKRPFVILKFAQTKDGFITHPHDKWISNSFSQRLVHKWRSEEQAIMVGGKTVIADNPQLTVRLWKGKNPMRIIIGRGPFPAHLQINNSEAETIVYETIDDALKELYNKNIISVLVEGGATLLQSFIDRNLWDEARMFIGNKFSGEGIKAPVIRNKTILLQEKIEQDELFIISR